VNMLWTTAAVAFVLSTVCGCGKKEMNLRQAETVAYRWLSDVQKMLSPKAGATTGPKDAAADEGDASKLEDDPFKPVRGPANPTAADTAAKTTASAAKVDQQAAAAIAAIQGIVLVDGPAPAHADTGTKTTPAKPKPAAPAKAATKHSAGPQAHAPDAAQTVAIDAANTTQHTEAKHEPTDKDTKAEFAAGPGPQTLRDCFVDDDWDPTGFKNPTEAIAWLVERPRPLTKVKSIELVEGSAEVTFEMMDQKPVSVLARVKLVDNSPKCSLLKVGS